MRISEPSRIFTIGHGNAPFAEIERILAQHGVATLVDVRSTPYSQHAPDFRKSSLEDFAAAAGLGYRWMGDRLGGRPTSGAQLATDTAAFQGAIDEVIALNTTGPVALLCAERDPDHCHRRLALAPQLEARGLAVFHILPDGARHRHQPTLGI